MRTLENPSIGNRKRVAIRIIFLMAQRISYFVILPVEPTKV